MSNKIAVVTGASSGMGLAAAVELAGRGFDVVATLRSPDKAGALQTAAEQAGVTVSVRALDVTDADSGDRLGEIAAEFGAIDVLINNAGQGAVGTTEDLTMDEIEAQLAVNYLGPVRLAKAVLPTMRERGSGRILTVTSVGGVVGQPFADAYCGAKFAVEGLMQSLAVVAHEMGVWVSVIEPAAVASLFVENANRTPAVGPYADLQNAYLSRTAGAFANAQSPADAGRAIADAATSPTYQFRWQTSDTARAFVSTSLADLDGSRVLGFTGEWIRPGRS
ncbi:SDR family NAD(P)-dependent oxidoreductase [Calidifontibacter terrae]